MEENKKDKMYFGDNVKLSLGTAIDKNYPILLVGETGVGKTSFVRDIALERGKRLIRLNLTGQTGVDEILGKYLVRSTVDSRGNKTPEMYWVDGLLVTAMKEGHWIVFDEINMCAAEILSVLHSLLDDDRSIVLKEKDGSLLKPHPAFRFFATMNPEEEYAGTKELNKAFLSRFPIVLDVKYSENEVDIINDRNKKRKKHKRNF